MLEECQSQINSRSKHHLKRTKKNIPKGTYMLKQSQKFQLINKYLLHPQIYHIICPFRYIYGTYVIVPQFQDSNKNFQFILYHQISKKPLLKAKKVHNVMGSKFIIQSVSSKQTNQKTIAYVRGNIMGNQFNIFDHGYNPKKKTQPIRKELGFISFQKQSIFAVKPFIGKFLIPLHNYYDTSIEQTNFLKVNGIRQIKSNESQLLQKFKNNQKTVFQLRTQQPTFNPSKKIYELDFKNLVSQVSPYNCILKTNLNQQCLVIGKKYDNTFIMYLGSPLSLVQGFGYFLANFINKQA